MKGPVIFIMNRLAFLAQKDAYLFFDVPEEGGTAALLFSEPVSVSFTDDCGRLLASVNAEKAEYRFTAGGIYRAILHADGRERTLLTVCADDTVQPFLMPGVGVLWQHGGVFPLLFAKEDTHTVYAVSDPSYPDDYKVAVIKGIPDGSHAKISAPDGSVFSPDWYPKLGRPWFWHSAELHTKDAAWTRLELSGLTGDARVTLWNCSILALREPIRPFAVGKLSFDARDEKGEPLDARYELFIGKERVFFCDQMAEESPVFSVPEGSYTLRVSHGVCHEIYETEIHIGKEPLHISALLRCVIRLPEGWALGELHTHSAFEDATVFPRQTMRAARANGRNFCFQTDKDVEALLAYGTHHWDIPGKFIGMPGQEIMCHELHMNVLNVDRQIVNPEADHLDSANPDIEERIKVWLAEYEKIRAKQPCTVVHNHPTHRAEVMEKGMPYFRSWWVSDLFRTFGLVENCSYQSWFDRLNRNRRLFCAWTGDGHDCSLMYPGKEGVCVYVGDTLSEASIISALEKGRFFSTREPGVFLDMKVSGVPVGGTVKRKEGVPLFAEITVIAKLPIASAELLWNGEQTKKVYTPDEETTHCNIRLDIPDSGVRFLVARVKLKGGEWNRQTHSFTPLMDAGYDAFTNPIFIEE